VAKGEQPEEFKHERKDRMERKNRRSVIAENVTSWFLKKQPEDKDSELA